MAAGSLMVMGSVGARFSQGFIVAGINRVLTVGNIYFNFFVIKWSVYWGGLAALKWNQQAPELSILG